MTPPQAATVLRQDFNSAQDTPAPKTQTREERDALLAAEPRYVGRLYIHDAVPMKGEEPDPRTGKMFYVLQCFPIPESATPGQVRAMAFTPEQAVYRPYYGHMSRRHGDPGLVVGYIDNCYGVPGVEHAQDSDLRTSTITQIRGLPMPRPQVAYDLDKPRFGVFDHTVQNWDETIATLHAIDAIRDPRPAPRKPRRNVLGG